MTGDTIFFTSLNKTEMTIISLLRFLLIAHRISTNMDVQLIRPILLPYYRQFNCEIKPRLEHSSRCFHGWIQRIKTYIIFIIFLWNSQPSSLINFGERFQECQQQANQPGGYNAMRLNTVIYVLYVV